MIPVNFNLTPLLVIWEATQACGLVCKHCRANAVSYPAEGELSTAEAKKLMSQVRKMGCPIFVISGGDPVSRPDIYELIEYGAKLGLRMATIPAASPTLNSQVIRRLRDAGISQIALSLDFPVEHLHDGLRGVPGTFIKTLQAIEWAHKYEVPLQINTVIYKDSLPYLPDMASFVEELGIVFWEVFFIVPVGRGALLGGLTAEDCERAFGIIYETEKKGKFTVKVTEAPHYRRFVLERNPHVKNVHRVNSGKGFMFISNLGMIYPNGFLPLPAGNVRMHSIIDVYRNDKMFKELREPGKLKGKCGACKFRGICGGSRARAYAITGDYLASDPWCAYEPSCAQEAEV